MSDTKCHKWCIEKASPKLKVKETQNQSLKALGHHICTPKEGWEEEEAERPKQPSLIKKTNAYYTTPTHYSYIKARSLHPRPHFQHLHVGWQYKLRKSHT